MFFLHPLRGPRPAPAPALTGHGSTRDGLDDQAVYNRLLPSVVDVTAVLRYDDETAEGTGFVFDGPGGLVLTNNHVIRDATSVTASFPSTGKIYRVRIVGTDTAADIAVLQLLHAPRIPAAPIGNSALVQLGDPVLAIGNQAGQGGPPTIAPGIINSLGRTIEADDGTSGFTETLRGLLQTSAQIEPGDSGGPLADAAGEVIGMDTAASTGSSAAGFAIPVSTAIPVGRQIAGGRPGPGITLGTGGFLGVLVVPRGSQGVPAEPEASLTARSASPKSGCDTTAAGASMPERVAPARSGALVEGVLCGAPAAASGLTAGDVIIRVAGQNVTSPTSLAASVTGCEPGMELPVTWVTVTGITRTALIRVGAAPAP
jgi:S1-C subfamily serine protease